MKTLTFPVSDELHSKFKEYCARKDIKMRDALTLAIQLILDKKNKK